MHGRSERRGVGTHRMIFWVTEDERYAIRKRAKAEGLTVSGWLRKAGQAKVIEPSGE